MNRIFAMLLIWWIAQGLHAQGFFRGFPTPPRTLQPGMSLQITLSGVPVEETHELKSQSFTIGADGAINLPHIGHLVVSELTMGQAERAIEREYVARKIYRFPTITIEYPPSRLERQRRRLPAHRLDAPGPRYREHIRRFEVANSQ